MHKHGASEVKTWHGINSAIQMPMMILGFSRSRPTSWKHNKLLTLECVLLGTLYRVGYLTGWYRPVSIGGAIEFNGLASGLRRLQ